MANVEVWPWTMAIEICFSFRTIPLNRCGMRPQPIAYATLPTPLLIVHYL
jgi:hypothetical protein